MPYSANSSRSEEKNLQLGPGVDSYPYGIPPPTYSYLGSSSRNATFSDSRTTRLAPAQGFRTKTNHVENTNQNQKRQDLTDSIMDWYSMSRSGTHEIPRQSDIDSARGSSDGGDDDYGDSDENIGVRRRNSVQSNASFDSDGMDSNDGRNYFRGSPSEEDSEKEVLRRMDYKTRRKHIQRIRIQFNVSGMCL